MTKLEEDADGYHSHTDDDIQVCVCVCGWVGGWVGVGGWVMDLATRPMSDGTAGGRAVDFSAAIQDAARVHKRRR